MKIAISSTGKDLESEIDVRFGRCSYFVFVDIEDKEIKNVEAIENQSQNQMGGAGVTSSEFVANKGIKAIITGNVGPRAFSVFNQFNIDIYQETGKIKDALEKFINGELEKVDSPTGPELHKK
jgi:predicted Fe-Mo cluster-binding NifX family protein